MNPKAFIFIGMGFELVAAVLGFLWLGEKLDHNFGWKGMGAALGIVLAMIGWITHLLIVVRSLAKDGKSGDSHSP